MVLRSLFFVICRTNLSYVYVHAENIFSHDDRRPSSNIWMRRRRLFCVFFRDDPDQNHGTDTAGCISHHSYHPSFRAPGRSFRDLS